eukprot:2029587-Alexandrium_andersonii.AAC.1
MHCHKRTNRLIEASAKRALPQKLQARGRPRMSQDGFLCSDVRGALGAGGPQALSGTELRSANAS